MASATHIAGREGVGVECTMHVAAVGPDACAGYTIEERAVVVVWRVEADRSIEQEVT